MSEVDQLEYQKQEATLVLERTARLERLLNNPDFREVIIGHFSRDDAARSVQESADPSLTAEQRADALAMAQAPGHLKRWINAQLQMANYHRNNKVALDEAINEARLNEESVG